MEATAHHAERVLLRRRPSADVLPALGAWTLGAALVGYLAFANGGYDTIVRGQVGIAIWWIVLVGAVLGVLPGRLSVPAWAAIGLLVALTAFAALSATWSESAERTVADVAKLATYAGVLVLGLSALRRGHARHLTGGVTAAIAVVGVLAMLSRLHPSWFPRNDQVVFLGNTSRLAYPLNYWNGLAAFAGMGIVLLVASAGSARRLAVQALAAGVVPAMGLAVYFANSRGGVIAIGLGLLVFLALTHDRLARLATVAVVSSGSAILIVAARSRPLVEADIVSAAGRAQGSAVLRLAVLVCAGTALLQVAVGLTARHASRPSWLEPNRRRAALAGTVAVLVLVTAGLATGAPGALADGWEHFKAPPAATSAPTGDIVARLQSATGNGRYQYWESLAEARDHAPWQGTGSGTFELWWARHSTTDGFVRDGHSLYMETMGELGWPGFLLVAAFLTLLLGVGVLRTLRSTYELRTVLAGATAAIAVFATTATFEWVFELGAIAVALMLLGAVVLVGHERYTDDAGNGGPLGVRVLMALLAVAAIAVIAVPVAGAAELRASQRATAAGRLTEALKSARTAQRVQPYAAAPRIQEALVRERARDYRGALSAIRGATEREPLDWRGWFIRARIEAEAGRGRWAVRSFARAKRLNPRSPLFRR